MGTEGLVEGEEEREGEADSVSVRVPVGEAVAMTVTVAQVLGVDVVEMVEEGDTDTQAVAEPLTVTD